MLSSEIARRPGFTFLGILLYNPAKLEVDMETRDIIGLVYLIFAAMSVYAPYVMLQGRPRWTGRQLAAAYPELNWIRFGYPAAYIGWILTLFGGYFWLGNSSNWFAQLSPSGIFFIMGAAFSTLSIINGVFTLISGACPLPRRRGMLFIYDDDLQPTGFLLIAIGLVISLAGLAVVFFNWI